eukprot:TRINITY_DN3179_c0_g4_i1.p1 TRINITY_DN3179_c0_g4~~TRINITY_DN3179_c0_g4_i1.p1  ORF type:complete len:719 (-),score=128.41 TRINITY_DN3179_c0_g4_i1:236-2320(-)
MAAQQVQQKAVNLAYVDGFSKCMELLVDFMDSHLQKSCGVNEDFTEGVYGAAGSVKIAVEQLQKEIRKAERTKFGPVKASRPLRPSVPDAVEITIQEEGNDEEDEHDLADEEKAKKQMVSVSSELFQGSGDSYEQAEQQLQIVEKGCRTRRPSAFGKKPVSIDELQGPPVEMPFGIINPGNAKKLAWDFFVMFCVVFDAVVLPFQLAFKNQMEADTFDKFWFAVTTTTFSIDIVLAFNTALDKGDNMTGSADLIKDRRGIAKRYLRGWFVIDFVSTIPWGSLDAVLGKQKGGSSSQATKLLKVVKFLRIMRLMRMLRLAKLKTIWENIENYLGSVVFVQSVMLVRILFVVIAICHWNACIFWVVGSPESFITDLLSESTQEEFKALPHWTTILRNGSLNEPTWRYLDRSIAENYIFCFYWTLGVMRTMPAEVTPVNLTERVFVLCFMFFALSAFAISVGSLTQAYFKISERGRNYNDEMFAVRMYLKKLKVTETAQRRIKNYLSHLFERRRIMAKEANLLDKLPETLKAEVNRAKIFQYLQRLPLIADLGKSAIEHMCNHLSLFDRLPGDTVCVANQVADAAWIVCAGRVQVEDDTGAIVLLPEPLQIVNMDCLMTADDTLCTFTVVAITCVEMLKVEKKMFLKYAMQQSMAMSKVTTMPPVKTAALAVSNLPSPPQPLTEAETSAANAAALSS